MRDRNRQADPSGIGTGTQLLFGTVGLYVVATAVTYVAVALGQAMTGKHAPIEGGFFGVLFGLASHKVTWPGTAAWVVLIGEVIVLALLAIAGLLLARRWRSRTTRVDRAARYMGAGRDIAGISAKSVAASSKRFGVDGAIGVPIGRTVAGNQPLFGSYEDMHIDVWGPRTGKTTSRAIPAILEAPGAVIVTSNKRDVVDATREVRAEQGTAWVFDPQSVANEEPTWWWNPLSYVTDEVKAARMADHFASGSREPGAKTDAYFDPAGQDLLAGLLLAAALENLPITEVYTWLTRPTATKPVEILETFGFTLQARSVEGVINAPDKQRGGIYGTAQQMASCLTNRQVAKWVTPTGPGDMRSQFDPAKFVRSRETMYSLSREGQGTAGPIVTALTVAIVEAAEQLATQSAGGRLPTPLVGVLDEAANVCRWRNLPDLYSHYGSRGIVLMTILQSWSQGCDVWGESGMKKLWSAANVKVYGGNVQEDGFLRMLSEMVGQYERMRRSTSVTKGQATVSHQIQQESILSVAELAAMPKGRALVFASGQRPTLIRTQPWMKSKFAAAVRASIAKHDPQAHTTIAQAETEVTAVDQLNAAKGNAL